MCTTPNQNQGQVCGDKMPFFRCGTISSTSSSVYLHQFIGSLHHFLNKGNYVQGIPENVFLTYNVQYSARPLGHQMAAIYGQKASSQYCRLYTYVFVLHLLHSITGSKEINRIEKKKNRNIMYKIPL